jgi:hypothetical protein
MRTQPLRPAWQLPAGLPQAADEHWAYLLDDTGIIYGPGWWPFYGEPDWPSTGDGKAQATRAYGVRLAPDVAFYAWHTARHSNAVPANRGAPPPDGAAQPATARHVRTRRSVNHPAQPNKPTFQSNLPGPDRPRAINPGSLRVGTRSGRAPVAPSRSTCAVHERLHTRPHPGTARRPTMTLHVVQYSGGIGSWAATQCVIAEHGTDHLVLLTADTRVEDPDLWRFVRDSTVHVGVEPTIVADGLTPFEVFHDQRFLGNSVSRPAQPSSSNDPAGHDSPCTPTWRTQCCTSASTGRKPAVSRRSNTAGHRGGCGSRCVTPYLSKEDMLDAARAAGLTPPRLYELGFSHNNFSGLRSAQQLRTWSHSAHGYAPGRTRVPMCVQPNLSRSGNPSRRRAASDYRRPL